MIGGDKGWVAESGSVTESQEFVADSDDVVRETGRFGRLLARRQEDQGYRHPAIRQASRDQ